jgi:hypothetical protein
MDRKWRILLKQAGVDMDQCVDLYGIDGTVMNSIDMEFYYHGDHLRDPSSIGKNYLTEEITQMLEDLEDHSMSSISEIDPLGLVPEKIQNVGNQEETIFNIIAAECMRGIAFNEIGDVINLCMKHVDMGVSHPSVLTNIATDNE